jgi:hypothetical protein
MMLDYFSIFTVGGIALFEIDFTDTLLASRIQAINATITESILTAQTTHHGTATTFHYQGNTIQYRYHVQQGLIFLASFPKAINASYTPNLLEKVEAAFLNHFMPYLSYSTHHNQTYALNSIRWEIPSIQNDWFQSVFMKILSAVEQIPVSSKRGTFTFILVAAHSKTNSPNHISLKLSQKTLRQTD